MDEFRLEVGEDFDALLDGKSFVNFERIVG
jgi:hypothetical protein